MRWVMLGAFLLAAGIEVMVFVQNPIFGAVLPLVLIVGLLVLQLQWLRTSHIMSYGLVAAYLVDVLAALSPGSVLVAITLALGLGVSLRLFGGLNPALIVPLAISGYFFVLWLTNGAIFGWTTVVTLTINIVVAIAGYVLLFMGAKKLEVSV